MRIRIDPYFDVTCDCCARSRSTDFEKGMGTSRLLLSRMAYSEGWKCVAGRTLCPECARKYRRAGDVDF